METAAHFKSLSLQDAMKCINQKVNITVIIVEFSSPKRSRGTDSSNLPMVREINEGVHCKLICKILHCRETANQERVIFVWDGTDLRPNSIISSKLEDELCNPLPLHPELVPLSRELLCTFPAVGSILRIAYDKSIDKNHINLLLNVKWVKIVNMYLEVRAGLWRGVLSPSTKLRYIWNDDDLVQQRQWWSHFVDS